MRDAFSACHPIVNFMYFVGAVVCSMFFLHPVLLPLSLMAATAYSIYLNGAKALKFNLLGMLPLMLVAAVINPLFNHAGVTILFYLRNGNPITLESVMYGISAGGMLITVIIWFSCYNAVMTSDKFIYLFGRIIPALSLIFSMALRFVPKFKSQIKVISRAQKCIGRDVSNGKLLARVGNGITILSILVTWALENAIETADSMKARGYGLKGRTSFSIFRFDRRDRAMTLLLAACLLIVICGSAMRITSVTFFPAMRMRPFSLLSGAVYLAYFLFLCAPLALNLWEDLKWKSIRSGI
jgi:energy-coupling factor transport system permease protein